MQGNYEKQEYDFLKEINKLQKKYNEQLQENQKIKSINRDMLDELILMRQEQKQKTIALDDWDKIALTSTGIFLSFVAFVCYLPKGIYLKIRKGKNKRKKQISFVTNKQRIFVWLITTIIVCLALLLFSF